MGLCVGSFLNVVIYRLPRDKSIVSPPSSCPSCGSRIRFYDNIPILSWLLLRGRCRFCKAAISPRYLVVELATGLLFIGMFWLYFFTDTQQMGLNASVWHEKFIQGGWIIYLCHLTLIVSLLAASAIDIQLWVIPISLCWFATVAGIAFAGLGQLVIDFDIIHAYRLLPVATPSTGALAAGAAVGTILSLILLRLGVIKPSYEIPETPGSHDTRAEHDTGVQGSTRPPDHPYADQPDFNDRREVIKECVFLMPILAGAAIAYNLHRSVQPVNNAWINFSQLPVVSGVLGALWGYFVGCGIVWITRILGTLGFGKEAMGLGDVHLMGAAGTVTGPLFIVVAFFVAPFFGLVWAVFQLFFKKSHEIPYGPFLSMGLFAVIIFKEWFLSTGFIQALIFQFY